MQKNSDKISKAPVTIATGFHMEVYKTALGFSLSVSGVEGIVAFSDTEIIVKLSAFSLRILGKGLYMSIFEEKRVEILGKITGVNILYGQT